MEHLSSIDTMKSRAPLFFIIFTVVLDAMGVGLILPVMPDLLREIGNISMSQAALWGGLLSFTYASMQFLCSPLLGNLSDSYGRRPVLILSLLCMGLNYLLMALTPTLLLLFVARLVSGATGATYSTAAAYLADISEKGKRSSNFGLIGAAFGIGFVLGPMTGGIIGEYGIRLPFIVAGALALANAVFGYFILPETLAVESRRRFEWRRCNPFTALLRARNLPMVGSLILIILVYFTAQNVYASVWSFFALERFNWSLSTVGYSLAAYGFSAAIVQAVILRKCLSRWGEERTATTGMIIAVLTLTGLVFVQSSLLVFVLMPIVALGAVVGPSIQGMMADRVSDDEQGELQGVFSSVVAIASIISPLLMSYIFKVFTQGGAPVYQPGAPFVAAAILALTSLIMFRMTRHERSSS